MKLRVSYTPVFEKYYKRYLKKFPSLSVDLKTFIEQLVQNPTMGISLGGGFYKTRLLVKSKTKGKSGGFRVITYFFDIQNSDEIKLLIIYDKSEIGDISKADLRKINL